MMKIPPVDKFPKKIRIYFLEIFVEIITVFQ